MIYNKAREGCKVQGQYKAISYESICMYLHACKDTSKEWSQLPAVVGFPLIFNSAVTCIDIIGDLSTTYIFVRQKKSQFHLGKKFTFFDHIIISRNLS